MVPAGAPGRRGIVSRWHLLRLGVLVVVAVVIAVGITDGRAPDSSVEPTVVSFLLAWQQGHYRAAARLTNGRPAAVADALQTAYNRLDAAALSFTMGTITQSGQTALARFQASVDLGQSGVSWNYTGWFPLRWTSAGWKIQWSPADINPGLTAGTRLAVRTTLPTRATILDASGQPLQPLSPTYELGVQPGRLADPAAAARALGQATGLDSGALLAQIQAGSGRSFLPLVTLDPATYARMSGPLRDVPGLVTRRVVRRLFDSIAPDVVGTVGTEVASQFRQNGIAYEPGDTTGLSGLQQAFQRRLVGMPDTEVVVEKDDGQLVSVLQRWSGPAAQPVRTTLSTPVQTAANQALASTSHAAAIVAVQASTGKILAVASQGGSGAAAPDPLAGRYAPGQAFTIVSTAALLDTGLAVTAPVPCTSANDVGGETFVNDPPARSLGPAPTFSRDFAYGCGTAFAGLSRRLSPAGLSAAAAGFGVGSSWRLPLTAFAGSMSPPASDAQLAADTIGDGGVQVSPLDMALIAGGVDAGEWHAPSLVTEPGSPADPPTTARSSALSLPVMTMLRTLMRTAVRSGAARQADLPGLPVYGQTGEAPLAQPSPSGSGSGSGPGSGSGASGTSGADRLGQTASGGASPSLQAWWFVGYRGDVAFAVLELGSSSGSAAPLAAQFLHRLPASLLNQ